MSIYDCITIAQGQAPAGGLFSGNFIITMGFMIAIFYFMLIRPQQRREKERQEMINNVKANKKVMFCGGMIGTIDKVKETTFIIKAGDGVKIEVLRGAVSRVIEDGDKLTGNETTQ